MKFTGRNCGGPWREFCENAEQGKKFGVTAVASTSCMSHYRVGQSWNTLGQMQTVFQYNVPITDLRRL